MAAEVKVDELRIKAKEAIITINKAEAFRIAEQASSELSGSDLVDLIEEGFRAGIVVVGDKFGRGDMFLPELVASAEAMKGAIEIMEPKLRESKIARQPAGRIVLATVKSDLHDIGKTMVASLLTASGFEVIDQQEQNVWLPGGGQPRTTERTERTEYGKTAFHETDVVDL